MDYEIFKILGTSLGLGLLVGLQREYEDHRIAGIRTFSLVALFGSISGLLAKHFQSDIIVASGFITLAMLLTMVNFFKMKDDVSRMGQTTEVAILLMYGLGSYLVFGDLKVAVALGVVTAVLLQLKHTLGGLVNRLQKKEVEAIILFAALSLVILPILPDDYYGPYNVFNPHDIWLMVILIVGLGLAGYFIYKVVGKNAGTVLNGILGGLVSSTATTVTFARQVTKVPQIARLAAFIILTASTVTLLRILVEVSVVTPQNLGVIAPPILVEFVFMAVLCGCLFWQNKTHVMEEVPQPENPAQLKTALVFGGLYAFILFMVAAAKDYFGESGLYIISIISGLTTVDAITLSLSHSLNSGELDVQLAWRLILVASLSNLTFKGGLAIFLGTKKLATYVIAAFLLSIVVGLLIVWLWPEHWIFGNV
jgi:uncharacterized membrane protein (DUF4010 family)